MGPQALRHVTKLHRLEAVSIIKLWIEGERDEAIYSLRFSCVTTGMFVASMINDKDFTEMTKRLIS